LAKSLKRMKSGMPNGRLIATKLIAGLGEQVNVAPLCGIALAKRVSDFREPMLRLAQTQAMNCNECG
jgi:hypothetical protein